MGIVGSTAQEKNVTTGNQQWLQYYNQTKLGKNWVWLTDGGYRWRDGFEESTKYIARTGLGYSINPNMRVSAGLAYLGLYSSGKVSTVELRPYQEFLLKNGLNKIGISNRFRVEKRFFNPVIHEAFPTQNTFNFRFRYAITASIPLSRLSKDDPDKKLLLNIGNEIFINAGNEIVHDVFDQNRFTVSPSVQCSENLTFSLTWNSQFSSTSTPESYDNNNVMWLQVRHTLDLAGGSAGTK